MTRAALSLVTISLLILSSAIFINGCHWLVDLTAHAIVAASHASTP